MVKMTQRLTRKDWILAGFRALAAGGVGALRVEPVARSLAATKGSFYWHFKDPADWQTAMLDFWEDVAFRQIVTELNQLPRGMMRLQALAQIATAKDHEAAHGGAAAEPALRDWARYAPEVARVVQRVDAARIEFVTACLEDCPTAAADMSLQARQFYAAYLGLQVLQGQPQEDALALQDLIRRLLGVRNP